MAGPAGNTDAGTEGVALTGEVEAVVAALDTDRDRGLTDAEAAGRLARWGPNRLVEPRRVTFLHILREEITEPMILLLIGVAVLYSLWGKVEDTIAIFVVIASVVLVEVYTEFRAKAAIAGLKALSAPSAPVVRDGQVATVASEAIVAGDIVVVRAGERIPADLRLLDSVGLRVDESALTGEAVPVDKQAGPGLAASVPLAERTTMVYAGTVAASGRGQGVVVATGMGTELGRITGLVSEAKDPRTPLQQAMRQLAGSLARLALAVSVVIPVIGVIAGQPVREMVLTGLTLAFATVPEELPIIITMVLGFGAFRLSRRKALVKRLVAAETLGAVSVLATDKTGTLTQNTMTVTHLWTGALHTVDGSLSAPQEQLVGLAARCLDLEFVGGDGQMIGDPMERAIAELAGAHGLLGTEPGRVVHEHSFDDGRKLMSVLYADDDGQTLLIAKGAPEALAARAAAVLVDGRAEPLTGERAETFHSAVSAMAADGVRVIAVAYREGVAADDACDDAERDLVLVGLVGLSDPPRPEASAAVDALQTAGVRVVMMTGDHPSTAGSIARAVGLPADGAVITGAELDALDDHQLDATVEHAAVFARLTPEHKLRLVRALHRRGEVVAVTGDGINDAPALREADVGVAMGATGTDVAREAADLVLADDNVATIAGAVREGRHLFDNLRKGVRFYLACKLALVAASAVGVLVGLPVPFAPIQIVVMELFMDIAASVTFVAEPAEGDVMGRPPRDPGAPFLDRALRRAMAGGAASLFTPVIGLYLWASWGDATTAEARTLAFVTWMVGTVLLAWVMRSERTPALRLGLLTNRFLPSWTAVTVAALVVFTTVPVLRDALRLATLRPAWWAGAVVLPAISMAVLDLVTHRRHQLGRSDRARVKL